MGFIGRECYGVTLYGAERTAIERDEIHYGEEIMFVFVSCVCVLCTVSCMCLYIHTIARQPSLLRETMPQT
jgi:hypothetical protein